MGNQSESAEKKKLTPAGLRQYNADVKAEVHANNDLGEAASLYPNALAKLLNGGYERK